MRFLFKALLAATALIPVAASAQDGLDRPERWRNNRGGAAEAKIEARNESRGIEAPQPQPRAQPQPQAQVRADWRGDRGGRADGGGDGQRQPRPEQRWDGNRGVGMAARTDAGAEFRRQPQGEQPRPDQRRWNGRVEGRAAVPQANVAVNRPGGPDWNNARADRSRADDRQTGRQGWRQDSNGAQQQARDDRRFDPRSDGRRQTRDTGRREDRGSWNQPGRNDRFDNNGWNQSRGNDRFQNGGNWSRSWRSDNRYDWNGYRASNRYAYRLPRYYAPSGWGYGYRRFSIGATLSSILWDESYWIEDPYSYRLPEAYGPYRWVRYYDDALLVDIRTGRVVDVVDGIFW